MVPSSPTIARNATLDVVLTCVGPPEGGRSNLRHSHAGYPMTGVRHLLLDVPTNLLLVPEVHFFERSLQGVLLSEYLPVDDPSHQGKR